MLNMHFPIFSNYEYFSFDECVTCYTNFIILSIDVFYLTNFLVNEVFKCNIEPMLNGSFTIYIYIGHNKCKQKTRHKIHSSDKFVVWLYYSHLKVEKSVEKLVENSNDSSQIFTCNFFFIFFVIECSDEYVR